jgi:hypothetical protein
LIVLSYQYINKCYSSPNGVNKVLGEEIIDETAEHAKGVDADAIKYAKHTANNVIDADHYRG